MRWSLSWKPEPHTSHPFKGSEARPQFWNAAGTPVLAVDSVERDLGVTQTPHWLQRVVVRGMEGGEKEATWLSQSCLLCLPWPELRFLSRFLP